MKEQDNYNNIFTKQSNMNSLSLSNDNNDKTFSNNNIQLNNFNQIPSNLNSNLNINNLVSLAQASNLNKNNILFDNNTTQNETGKNINEFPLIEENNHKNEILNNLNNQNNNIYNNQNNNIYNFNNNYYNNNNYYITGNNNKGTKPYFTSKHVLLNAHSLDEINESINKDLFQLEKFLPNYKNYIGNNNSESIYICLKYIEYTNFFFSQAVTNKVNELLKKIIYSDNYNNNYGNINNHNNEIYIIKKKIKELYNKLIPFDFRMNYLNHFYENNCEKKLYILFKNDLNKYQRYNDKKYYLYEIFEIVKQKMDIKDREEIKNYFNRIFYKSNNQNVNNNYNNLFPIGNNGINNDKNGGNYTNNYNNYHNNNTHQSHQYRKYSYQSPNSKNNANYNYDNNTYNNNGNNYHHNFNNNKNNNYNLNLSEEDNNMGYKNNYDNNNHHHNSVFQRKNNYKGSYSSRHYYNNNNNNKNNNIRNKGNRKNSAYSGVLVEVDSTPIKVENDNNSYLSNKEEPENNIINNENKEEIINGNENENEIDNKNPDSNEDLNKEKKDIINNEEIDLENNLNINNENNKKENIHINEEEPINKSDDNLVIKDENLLNDSNSNSINPFHENITSSEENSIKEDSNNQLSLKNEQIFNDDINKLNNSNQNNNIDNNINNQEEKSLILNIINNTQNNIINSALYENNLNNIEHEQQNNIYNIDHIDHIDQIEDVKKNDDIKNENDIKNSNTINNKIIYNNESRDISPKKKCISDNNIQKINLNLNNNSSNLSSNDIGHKNISINQNNNNNNNNNSYNNNITNEQLQLLKLMMLQNNNMLLNINPFHNNQSIKVNQSNNFQINNNNINTNFNNLNLLNNISQKINLFNNNYYQNNYQNYNTIFFNYWNDENNLLSNLRNNTSNIHSSNYNNNMNYINKKSEKLSIEYNKIKKFEKENPEKIKEFMDLFEEKIILPIYTRINEENQIKKDFYTEIYNKYKNIILKVFSNHNIQDTNIEPFGSIVNNFMTEWGDIDICIVPNDNNLIQSFWEYLEEIKEEAINIQKIAKFILIERYPRFLILKLNDIETNIDLDITVQNKLPILNTKLIRLYSLLDQRFHILGIFLKFWVKKNKIHGALDKFLSSYALLILIIHYLQNITEPKVLPILQQIQNVKDIYIYHYEEKEIKTNLYFEEDLDKINNYMNIINDKKENNNSITELLIGFFDFYAYKYNHYLISISKSDKKALPEEETIAFPLEDPFDVNYNPGKSMKLNTLQYSAFIYCMKKELNNILSGEYFKFIGGE